MPVKNTRGYGCKFSALYPILPLVVFLSLLGSVGSVRAQGLAPEPPGLAPMFRSAPTFRAYLPPKTDLSRHFPEPGHQGTQGSCVGWAVAYAVRSYYDIKGGLETVSKTPYSPAFLYNNLIKAAPTGCLTGTSISSALEFVEERGLVDIETFPYEQNSCSRIATPAELDQAKASRIKGWKPINFFQLDNIKGRLSEGDPVIAGIRVSQDLYDLEWGEIYDNRSPSDGFGHAVVIVGYSDKKQAFRFLNSWGREWSEGGYGWISYPAMEARVLSAFYIETDPSANPPAPSGTSVAQVNPSSAIKPEPPTPSSSTKKKPVTPVEPAARPKSTKEGVGEVVVPAIETDSPDGWTDFLIQQTLKNINGLECTHFEAHVNKDGKVDFRGVTGTHRDGVLAKRYLRGIEDDLGEVDIAIREWPICEAIETFWDELRPGDNPEATVLSGETTGQLTVLNDKQELKFDITAPEYSGYLYAIYLQANGEAVHLTKPGEAVKIQAGETIALGHGKGQPRYVIGPPFGNEMVLLLSSEVPIVAKPHARIQTDRDFLSSYRQGIFSAREGNPGARVTASAVYLRTREAE